MPAYALLLASLVPLVSATYSGGGTCTFDGYGWDVPTSSGNLFGEIISDLSGLAGFLQATATASIDTCSSLMQSSNGWGCSYDSSGQCVTVSTSNGVVPSPGCSVSYPWRCNDNRSSSLLHPPRADN